jgi:hypothetical protein
MKGEECQLEENCTVFCGLSVNDLDLKEELFGAVTLHLIEFFRDTYYLSIQTINKP